ncbi:MAG: ABC transporter permease [Pseudomonadota bacterium]
MNVGASRRWRFLAITISAVVLAPVVAGLSGILLPALNYFPALGADELGFSVFGKFLGEPGIWRSIGVSAFCALAATALSVGLTAAILAAAFGTPALRIAERLLAPILSVPHAAAALGFVFLFAPSGFVLRALSPWATGLDAPPDLVILNDPVGWSLVAALTMKETPFLFLMALAALGQVDAAKRASVARTLGYGRILGFIHAVWPLIYRQLKLPILAVLAFAASVVDMALILGPTRPATLSVRILRWLQSPDLDGWLLGSAGALAMVLLVAALIVVWLLAERAAGAAMALWRFSGWRGKGDGLVRWFALSVALLGVGIGFVGFGGLVVQSVAGYWPFPDTLPKTLSTAGWAAQLPVALPVLAQTIVIALGATFISLPLAVALLEAAQRGVRLPLLIYAPLVTPQVAFLFGLSVFAVSLGVQGGMLSVTLSHVVFTLPYALIALSGPWSALDPRYEMVAASIGAGPWRRLLRVRLALMARPLAVAAALCVAVSVGLYLPTQMIGAGRVATVTTEAVAAASAGDRRLIGIFASLQLLLPFVAFALARGGPALATGRWGAVPR